MPTRPVFPPFWHAALMAALLAVLPAAQAASHPMLRAAALPAPDVTLEINQYSAHLGTSAAAAGDVNGDGYADIIVGANAYDNGQTNEGAAFIFHGSASGIHTTPAATLESNQAEALLGSSVSGAGDINGDGYADVIAGAPAYDNGQTNEGAVFVYYGSSSGVNLASRIILESNQAEAYLGTSVAGAGDINGDGYDDIVAGAYLYDNGQENEGAIFIYYGSPSGLNPTPTILEYNQRGLHLGTSVAGAGDVNQDGYDDVIAGAPEYSNGQSREGAALLYPGSSSGLVTPPAILESNQASALLGTSVAGAGDVNQDGYPDIIVGAPFYDKGQDNEGAAFVYHGSASGVNTTPASILEGNLAGAQLGGSVSGAGDINCDGYADVIAGADNTTHNLTQEGAAYVFYGSSAGIDPASVVILESNLAGARLGASVAGAGDVNGDGCADFIAGAPGYDHGQTDEGAVFVYYGAVPVRFPVFLPAIFNR